MKLFWIAPFQLGHFFAEMDRLAGFETEKTEAERFQLGHFFAEMDRATIFRPLLMSEKTRFTSIPLTIQLFYEI